AVGVAWGVALGMASGVAGGIGALRIPFYLFQVWSALWRSRPGPGAPARLARHPALGDELAVLPFPRLGRLLAEALVEDIDFGLQASRALLRNSFQRWAVARAWAHFLSAQPCPLVPLYRALPDAALDESPGEPLDRSGLRLRPSVRALWLGELAGIFVDPIPRSGIPERLVWALTRPLRGRPDPRVAPLARFLLHLIQDEDHVLERGPDPDRLEGAVRAVAGLPHGEEVIRSLRALARIGDAQGMEDIAQADTELAWLDRLPEEPLRPQMMEALRGLWDVATEARRFREATSPADQAAALNRAIGMLAELEKFVEGVRLPEQVLLRRAVRRWREIVAEAAGRLGEQALREMAPAARRALVGGERRAAFWSRPAEPFPCPYQTGRPVEPPLFVGRQDIIARIREIWTRKPNPDSVILYGHRRMGKTSILRNLGPVAPPGSLLVYADLKGQAAFAQGTHDLLQNLAQEVAWAAQGQGLEIPDPSPADYAAPPEAARAFRGLLRRVLALLPAEGILILALDEFETVDVLVRDPQKPFGPELYDFLRDISFQNRVAIVLAGLHTLDEMSRDYRHAFHESYVNLHISYLTPEAAEQLITRPTPDFRLNYHPEVVRRIIEVTHGQPLLIQRICTELVHRLNHELFDLEKDREARVLPEDLDAVLTDDFIRTETRYFEGIWNDQIRGRRPEEAVLGALAAGPMSEEELARATGLSPEDLRKALTYLQTRDLIGRNAAGRWDLLVPLMRRWLQLNRELWASKATHGNRR
ncbi:AAA family ATPase, partial [Thermoflexus hugenholtzii]